MSVILSPSPAQEGPFLEVAKPGRMAKIPTVSEQISCCCQTAAPIPVMFFYRFRDDILKLCQHINFHECATIPFFFFKF